MVLFLVKLVASLLFDLDSLHVLKLSKTVPKRTHWSFIPIVKLGWVESWGTGIKLLDKCLITQNPSLRSFKVILK